MDKQDKLDDLIKLLSNSTDKTTKEKMEEIFDLVCKMDKIGAKDSLQALREIDAARKIFDLVCKMEYTGMAVQAFSQMQDQSMMDRHVKELNQQLAEFQPEVEVIMDEAKIKFTLEGGIMHGPKTNIALQSAFHYYERTCAFVKQLDNQHDFPLGDLKLILKQVEAFAEFQLNCYGYKTHGDVLPINLADHIRSMQNLN